MAVTLQNIKDFLGTGSAISDDTLTIYLDLAEKRVIGDGVAATDAKYDDLTLLAVGLLIVTMPMAANSAGVSTGTSSGIKKEEVADVKIEYGDGGGGAGGIGTEVLKRLAGGGYEREYLRKLASVITLDHLLV